MAETVTIEKLVYGGDGLSRTDGQVMLTPFVLPGETVSVETAKKKSGLLRGMSPSILEASDHRVVPRCEYFGVCGGCQYQHADYSYQLAQKAAILRETLERLGGIKYGDEIPTISGEPWNYRNRVQLHFAERQSGFHLQGSHALCAIDHCEISAPLLVEAIERISGLVQRPEWPVFLRSLELFTNGTDLQINILDSTKPVAARFFTWLKSHLTSLAPGTIEYEAAGYRFRISGGSFFQVNRFLVDALVGEAIGDASGEHAVDLYAGVGLFALPLAERFARVEAVERGLSAMRDLEHNVSQAGGRIGAVKGNAEDYISDLKQAPDLLIADPPRTGLGKEVTARLLELRPRQLTIVSCDPATLARDARTLLGSYTIRRLALVDLFPQTYHFETVMSLSLTPEAG